MSNPLRKRSRQNQDRGEAFVTVIGVEVGPSERNNNFSEPSGKSINIRKELSDLSVNSSNFVHELKGRSYEQSLMEIQLSKDNVIRKLATSIFDAGLESASPKVIIPLLPNVADLSSEHIKSHLQKFRINKERSKEEFIEYFNRYIINDFSSFDGREENLQDLPIAPLERIPLTSQANSDNLRVYSHFDDNLISDRIQQKRQKISDLEQLLHHSNKILKEWKQIHSDIYRESSRLNRELVVLTDELIEEKLTSG